VTKRTHILAMKAATTPHANYSVLTLFGAINYKSEELR